MSRATPSSTPIMRLAALLLCSAFGTVLAAPDLAVRLQGNTVALVGGQVGYIAEVSNVAPAGAANDASNVSLTLTLPPSLSKVFWDCLALAGASCGSNIKAENAPTTVTLTGLSIPAGSGTVRFLIQGSATVAESVVGTAVASVAGESVTGNNTQTLSTTINPFPKLCTTATSQVERRSPVNGGTASATDVWPLDASNIVTTSVSGGITATTGSGTQGLANLPAIRLSSTNGTMQRTSANFTYSFTLSKPVPAKQVYFNIQDVNVNDSTIILSVLGGASPANFAPVVGGGEGPTVSGTLRRPLAFDSATGRIYRQVDTAALGSPTDQLGTVRGSLHFFGTGEELVSGMTVTGTNVPRGEQIAYTYGAQVRCPVYTISKAVDTPLIKVSDVGGVLTYNPDQVKYTITVQNVGEAEGNNVTVTDALPEGLKYASATANPALAAGQPTAQSPVTFVLPTLAVGASQTYTITADVALPADTNQTAKNNAASVSSANLGAVAVTSNTVTTDVMYPKVQKRVQNLTAGTLPSATGVQGKPEDILEYCIDAINYGSLPLNNFVLADNVPLSTSAQLSGYGEGLGVRQTVAAQTNTLSSAVDADAAALSATGGLGQGVMTLRVGTLDAASVQTACFRAKIN